MRKLVEICYCDRCKKEITTEPHILKYEGPGKPMNSELCEECIDKVRTVILNEDISEYCRRMELEGKIKKEEPKANKYKKVYTANDVDFESWLPTRLRRFLKLNHMSQVELGEFIGVSEATVSRWINGAVTYTNGRCIDALEHFVNDYLIPMEDEDNVSI